MQMPDIWPWGIAAAAVAIAFKTTLEWVKANGRFEAEKKKVDLLEAEIASLKNTQNEKDNARREEFTKRLDYPKIHNS